MYKLGINYAKSSGLSIPDSLRLFVRLGFDAFFTGSAHDGIDIAVAAEEAAKNGIFYESVHAPWSGINNIWSSGEDGDIVENRLVECVRDCGRYGVPIVVMHLSSGEKAPHVNDTGRARFDRIVEAAVKENVVIAFENQRKLANIAFVFELYENVPNVKFCWDVGHEKCFTRGREYMPLFGDKLVYTHIHDNFCEYDKDLHLLPFDGCIDYSLTAKRIAESGYDGTLTLEVGLQKNKYSEITPEDFYAKAYGAASKLRDMCIAAK